MVAQAREYRCGRNIAEAAASFTTPVSIGFTGFVWYFDVLVVQHILAEADEWYDSIASFLKAASNGHTNHGLCDTCMSSWLQ